MISFSGSLGFWSLAAIHILGFSSAWLVRMSVGSVRQALFQRLFLLFLCLVATATYLMTAVGPHHWLLSGATMALMVITVVCDFRGSLEAQAT